MPLGQKAAKGAAWTVISSIAGRAVGVIGTLVITRFLAPGDIGEVSAAAILALTASTMATWGFGQYTVVRGRGDAQREVRWHATFFYVVLGAVSCVAVTLLAAPLTRLVDAPNAARFVPGTALAVFIRRLGAIPERVLTQSMNFRPSGLALALGEASFTATALPLAAAGWGGWSIVVANIIKSTVAVCILVSAAGVKSWATPTRLSLARTKDMLKFGVPLGIQGTAHMASRYWDNLAVSYWFGTRALGAYNMAYNLADIPAVQVGEQIALVLLPSMAELPKERRPWALERSAALLSLVIFPLAIGLGVIAYPLIAWILPANAWQDVAPLLTVLACLSVFRPITWVLSAYMESQQKTGRLMFLEIAQVGCLIAGIGLLSPFGLHVAAAAVGLAFGLNAVGGVAMVVRHGASPARLALAFVQPLAACAIMAAAVWLTHGLLGVAGVRHAATFVFVEIVVGAAAYVAAALVICRETSRDLLSLVTKMVRR